MIKLRYDADRMFDTPVYADSLTRLPIDPWAATSILMGRM